MQEGVMSDDAALPLEGEKLSSPSFSGASAWSGAAQSALGLVKAAAGPRAATTWAVASLCGALCSWGAPALVLHWYRADQLLDALVRSSVGGGDGEFLAFSLLLAYLVASGFFVASATARLARRLGRRRVALHFAVAPLIALSLTATMAVAIPLFIGLLIRCFPSLLTE
jgi:hypothetical protein